LGRHSRKNRHLALACGALLVPARSWPMCSRCEPGSDMKNRRLRYHRSLFTLANLDHAAVALQIASHYLSRYGRGIRRHVPRILMSARAPANHASSLPRSRTIDETKSGDRESRLMSRFVAMRNTFPEAPRAARNPGISRVPAATGSGALSAAADQMVGRSSRPSIGRSPITRFKQDPTRALQRNPSTSPHATHIVASSF